MASATVKRLPTKYSTPSSSVFNALSGPYNKAVLLARVSSPRSNTIESIGVSQLVIAHRTHMLMRATSWAFWPKRL